MNAGIQDATALADALLRARNGDSTAMDRYQESGATGGPGRRPHRPPPDPPGHHAGWAATEQHRPQPRGHASTIRRILKQARIPPTPRRGGDLSAVVGVVADLRLVLGLVGLLRLGRCLCRRGLRRWIGRWIALAVLRVLRRGGFVVAGFVRRLVLQRRPPRIFGRLFGRSHVHQRGKRRGIVRLVGVRLGLRRIEICRRSSFGGGRRSHAINPTEGPKESSFGRSDAKGGPSFSIADFAAFSVKCADVRNTKRRAGPAGAANSAACQEWRSNRKNPVKAWKNHPAKMAWCLRQSLRNKSIRTIP